jgi:hypothetical protein
MIGVIGENTRQDGWVEGCLYFTAGKVIKNHIVVAPMVGVGKSFYNHRDLQLGGLVVVNIKFISFGCMYNTTSKLSLLFGINFKL